ncbi:MAG: hypothetical protein WC777_02815 [Candidatus Gracilibacteria bacterium]
MKPELQAGLIIKLGSLLYLLAQRSGVIEGLRSLRPQAFYAVLCRVTLSRLFGMGGPSLLLKGFRHGHILREFDSCVSSAKILGLYAQEEI